MHHSSTRFISSHNLGNKFDPAVQMKIKKQGTNTPIQQQLCTNNDGSGCFVNRTLLPHQAQKKMHDSQSFREAVLAFKGQSNSLIERAIELDYITRLRDCVLSSKE